MHFSTCLLAAFALTAFPLAAQQPKRPTPEPAPQAEPEWPWGNAKEADRLRGDLLGTWQLLSADMRGTSYAGRTCGGYMLVLPGYVSMHTQLMLADANDPRASEPSFASGTHRWFYDEGRLLLVLNSLLSVNDMNSNAEIDYEAPGTQREYQMDLVGDDLTLTHGADVRLRFHRLSRALPPPAPSKPAPLEKKPAR